ncbi:hypothetical protein QEJ31_03870 [Pigmentibacter sp. JX0631]|uniref:hypothetical protein n=1 Tax=Pigmentibacter sp. JX0631 TaxID=2976982 RepID=UPI001F430B91|nr:MULTISPECIES: hypothetical protein [Pigmentibacter]WGL60740.1 hypothetical protein QEJ31_03870 [Pigmentibacter sp. JX0631]
MRRRGPSFTTKSLITVFTALLAGSCASAERISFTVATEPARLSTERTAIACGTVLPMMSGLNNLALRAVHFAA